MISGSLIALVGYYVPFMWAGSALLTIGSGLLFTLDRTSSAGEWIGYQFLAAFGAGICRQIGFSAVPLVFGEDDLPAVSALVAFCNSLGPALAIAIGQSIFTNEFVQHVAQAPGIDIKAVIDGAVTDLSSVAPSPLVAVVIQAFEFALARAFTLAVASAGIAFCCSLAMEWIDVKEKK